MRPLIALIDGPLAPGHPARAACVPVAGKVPADSPGGRHATAVAQAILSNAPAARFLCLPVFGERLVTSAAVLARALRAAAQADLAHCSLGLARPDPGIDAAVVGLLAAGRIVVAAAPARGGAVWPAACPGVTSVQGDARCGPGEWSRLDIPGAAFGACPRLEGTPGVAGASIAAAHLSGLIGRLLEDRAPEAALTELRSRARFVGRERRR